MQNPCRDVAVLRLRQYEIIINKLYFYTEFGVQNWNVSGIRIRNR